MDRMLKDIDIYITIPRKLFGETVQPYYSENITVVAEILDLIYEEEFDQYPFFSEHCKEIDFSQFKPRGHYTDDEVLEKYFRVMMWLGRIEIYLLQPEGIIPLNCPLQTKEDVQRQAIDAVLITELIDLADVNDLYEEIEEIILFMAGEQDNVTLPNLRYLIEETNLNNASQLLDTTVLKTFQDVLLTQSWAYQRILSQVLAANPVSSEPAQPASAFMLFGQRFVIDSYVTGNVVYDRIKYNDEKICRLFPSTLDILFALGNDASSKLLVSELDQYHYSTNLVALRYLIDSYDDSFWSNSIFSMWLNTIRALNPPANRDSLPGFMQTGAWWQEKMNTQLSNWTELRHDYLLYAKQSYTWTLVCSYPYGFVEPIPEVYQKLSELANIAYDQFNNVTFSNDSKKRQILRYFNTFHDIMMKLKTIAQKELKGEALSENEINFIQSLLYKDYVGQVHGWYLDLLTGGQQSKDFSDYIVADYHTTPSDCGGGMMGWVSHAGTGPVDLAIVTAAMPDSQIIAFVGPVMSYYEYKTTNFDRLTDEEWENTFLQSALRPNWVNIYTANITGETKGEGRTLTSIKDSNPNRAEFPSHHILAKNFPNPFNSATVISFSIPPRMMNSFTELSIYNIQGHVVKRLIKERLPAGSYLTKWDATNDFGEPVASGLYFYEIRIANSRSIGKMIYIK
jgi:hypothetical protein